MKCWKSWSKGHHKTHREQRPQTPAEMRQTPVKGAARFCQRKLSGWKCVRGKWAWQDLRDRTIRRCHYAEPILFSGVPEKRLCSNTWVSWSVAAFSRESSLCPWSAIAARNSWVERAGLSKKSVERAWAGATEGENQEGSFCGAWLWASICWGSDRWWGWCCWRTVASSHKSVSFGGCIEDGRQLRTRRESVGAICANCWASQHWCSKDLWKNFSRFRIFPESLRFIPDS